MSFSGFTFQKKASQSRVKLEAGASLGDEERPRGRGESSQRDEGKDYVLSLEGKTIHRLVGTVASDIHELQYNIPHSTRGKLHII